MQEAAVRAVQNAMGSTALPGVLSMVGNKVCECHQGSQEDGNKITLFTKHNDYPLSTTYIR